MICLDPSQVEAIFRSENVAQLQALTLSSAEVITFACAGSRAHESAASSMVQVELETWLDPAQKNQIEKTIHTGKGKTVFKIQPPSLQNSL